MSSLHTHHNRERLSIRSNFGSEVGIHPDNKFDEGRIIEHYERLKEEQQQKLANLNLSEQLKRKLFGFSQSYYLTNNHDPYRLLMENHPLRGRTLITEERYHYQLQNRHRQQQFRHGYSGGSLSRDYSQSRVYMDSDIEVKMAMDSSQRIVNPEMEMERGGVGVEGEGGKGE